MPLYLLQLFTIAAAVAAGGGSCLPVLGERILAMDLARAVPAFAAVPGSTPIAYAPAPGAQRIFRSAELHRLAERFGVSTTGAADVCFALPMQSLDRDRLVAAIRATPGFAAAHIEIVDFSRFAVPLGTIEFSPAGLGADSVSGALWKGYVRYGANRRAAIWAKARIALPLQRVIALENLKEGQPIEAGQVRLEKYDGFPPAVRQAQNLEQVVGSIPRRSIAAGSNVLLSLLAEPSDIRRGDIIDVVVRSGSAKLALPARAEAAGRLGQSIPLRNLGSGKTFSARVTGKGKAEVIASRTDAAESAGENQ